MNFSIEIYKTKVDNEILNNTLLKLANFLEQDNDTYIDNFPISIEPYEFKIQESEQKTFKNPYICIRSSHRPYRLIIYRRKHQGINHSRKHIQKCFQTNGNKKLR